MSLINLFTDKFYVMNKVRTSDGEGGFVTTWTEGAIIDAALTQDTTMQARIAEQQGVTSTYTITTKRITTLEYHDVIKRVSDGSLFRVTSYEKKTPPAINLDIAQVTAEAWRFE